MKLYKKKNYVIITKTWNKFRIINWVYNIYVYTFDRPIRKNNLVILTYCRVASYIEAKYVITIFDQWVI